MQLLQSRRENNRPKRWLKIGLFIGAGALGVGAWMSWDVVHPRYLRWKQQRALEQAKRFMDARDPANAQLALEVALKTIPGDPDTIRLAADMLEQVNSPQAMRLRRSVVQRLPHSSEDAARLVLCCLHFNDFNAAKDALSATPPAVASELPMLRAALAFAVATNNSPVADYLLDQLRAQSPDDRALSHAQALLWLRHPQEETRSQARRDLEELARQTPALALQIQRELAGDALQRRDYAGLKEHQQKILADPGVTFSDRLQKANVDLLVDQKPFETIFDQLAPEAVKSAADATQFVQWLLVQSRAALADNWLARLPSAVRQTPEVRNVEADVAAQLENWDRLASLLNEGAWGPISPDTLRLAFAAHTVNSPTKPSLRRETWDMTLESCAGNLGALRVLQRLAVGWRWSDETERTLWSIARAFPDQTWSHQALFNFYREKKDAKGMREVMDVLRRADGTVPRYQHDWALLTMLAEPNSNWNPAKDTMRKLHESDPANANYATGYAFALALAGKPAEALAVAEKMSSLDREYPPRQPYLAFVYGLAKKGPELEETVKRAEGTAFLPEENYLFTRAREELNRKPVKPAQPGNAETETPLAQSL